MEHYALKLPAGIVPALPGIKVARALIRASDGKPEVDCQVLPLIAFQSFHVFHYVSEQPRPVEASPELMGRNGWHYKHSEVRVAAVAIERDGRVALLEAEDANWCTIPAEWSVTAQEERCEELRKCKLIELASEEERIKREQGMVEAD